MLGKQIGVLSSVAAIGSALKLQTDELDRTQIARDVFNYFNSIEDGYQVVSLEEYTTGLSVPMFSIPCYFSSMEPINSLALALNSLAIGKSAYPLREENFIGAFNLEPALITDQQALEWKHFAEDF